MHSQLFNFYRFISSKKELKKYASSLANAIEDKGMLYSEELVNLDDYEGILNENSMDFGINLMTHQE